MQAMHELSKVVRANGWSLAGSEYRLKTICFIWCFYILVEKQSSVISYERDHCGKPMTADSPLIHVCVLISRSLEVYIAQPFVQQPCAESTDVGWQTSSTLIMCPKGLSGGILRYVRISKWETQHCLQVCGTIGKQAKIRWICHNPKSVTELPLRPLLG